MTEKFKPELAKSPEKLIGEVADLNINVDALKGLIGAAGKAGLAGIKAIFKRS